MDPLSAVKAPNYEGKTNSNPNVPYWLDMASQMPFIGHPTQNFNPLNRSMLPID
jgi:hypothetical protein